MPAGVSLIASGAVEQRHSDLLLEIAHRLDDRGFRAELLASRGGETSFIDGGDEGTKLIEGNAIQHETPDDWGRPQQARSQPGVRTGRKRSHLSHHR
jgi:hypothetical protein